jgi:hypothetical protein
MRYAFVVVVVVVLGQNIVVVSDGLVYDTALDLGRPGSCHGHMLECSLTRLQVYPMPLTYLCHRDLV